MQKRRILITGASGFIGSWVTERALELGYETWAGVRRSSSRQYLRDGCTGFIDLHYADKQKLKEQFREFAGEQGFFDDIVHIAGATKARRRADFDRVNYEQTRNLVNALIETGNTPRSFVYMSSLDVMGTGDETGYTPMRPDKIPAPNTAYGKSKLKAENWLKSLGDNFPYLILRPTGVYGPRDRDYLILMRAVKNGLDIGAGYKKQLLSFIYVEDLADVVFTLIEKGIRRKEYFVADGDVYTDAQFNAIVRDALHRKNVLRVRIPLFLIKPAAVISEKFVALLGRTTTFNSDKYRIMKQRNWACDVSPLKADIGFRPGYRLAEGVKKTVEWYQREGWL
ncbi:MAG: NAD-dependent epimerase/dehydratase family protein [Proteiniphilum sp.]|jgi:nucleoside-diphosphate-sugar epimerase|nr:NAD-dependent epimerase/dehydratase family protein [Proteiniphilum sp.]